MLEVTRGQTKNQQLANDLIALLRSLCLEGSLYIGYPVIPTADDSVTVDALLVTPQHGLVAFLFDETPSDPRQSSDPWQSREDRQDKLFVAVENNLRKHQILWKGRRLGVVVQTVMLMATKAQVPKGLVGQYPTLDEVVDCLDKLPPLEEGVFKPLQAALQRVSTIKSPRRRSKVTRSQSKGATLRQIEKEIANLDQWQKRAAIESPDGPQRIRGLAGSGKTVVLALKAVYLHAQNPDWSIVITFSSRALYQQFEDLVRRFSYEHLNDEPNWENLRLLHSWGGKNRDGLYQQIAVHCGLTPRDFLYGKSKYGMDGAFEGVCSEFLSATANTTPEPIYDTVLIDEAQDLPASFFRMVYRMTKEPKRIIWAYDELQKLSDSAIPTLEEMFGQNTRGKAKVSLIKSPNAPQQDIVLPVCYRNTPWALTLAHGLGLGTSREEGLVQSFDEPTLWTEIGYEVLQGDLQEGSTITLKRAPGSYPEYLPRLLTPDETVSTHFFEDEASQAQWIAQEIKRNLEEDELDHEDILVVLPRAYTARTEAMTVLEELGNVGVSGHLAGVSNSQDEIFIPDSIAIANIYRSKGNESSMVYILSSQHCVAGRGLATARNILFTAITRSKAWVRLCGWGEGTDKLQKEIESIRNDDFRLSFRLPTDTELDNMRQIHRDLTASEKAKMDKAESNLRNFLDALEHREISVSDLPIELRSALAKILGERNSDPA